MQDAIRVIEGELSKRGGREKVMGKGGEKRVQLDRTHGRVNVVLYGTLK